MKTVCLDNKKFKQAFSDKISSKKKERLIDHISNCNICRKKFEVMKQLRDEIEKKAEILPETKLSKDEIQELRRLAKSELEKSGEKDDRKKHFGLIPKPLYVSAALIAVVIICALLIPNASHQEIYRAGTKGKFDLISPSGELKAPPTDFKWNRIKGADLYFFKIIDENLEILFKEESATNNISLPAEIQNQLIKGKTYIWEVSASGDDGLIIDSQSSYFAIK